MSKTRLPLLKMSSLTLLTCDPQINRMFIYTIIPKQLVSTQPIIVYWSENATFGLK